MSNSPRNFLYAFCMVFLFGILVAPTSAKQNFTPIDQEIAEQEITAVFPEAGQGKLGVYRVWLPVGYNDEANAERTYPVLLVDVANGNSHSRFPQVREWVERNGWICVMPTDVKNGPVLDIDRNYSLIFPDIKQRFRLTPHCGIMTGMSGGSRRTTRYGNANQDIFGGIINNGGVNSDGAAHCKDRNMMVMVFSGTGCFNIAEIQHAINFQSPDRCQIRLFDGGHTWGTVPMQEEAMDWMAAGLLTNFGEPEPALDLLNLLKTEIESTESQYRRYLLMGRYVGLANSQRAFKKDADLKAIAKEYKAEVKKLSRDKELRTELEAMAALQAIRQQYATQIGQSLNWANGSLSPPKKFGQKVIAATDATRQQTMAALQTLAEQYPGSEAVAESQIDVQAMEGFAKRWR